MKYIVKIINKSKDGVTIKFLKGKKSTFKMTWNEFNKQFNIVDNYYANLKSEVEEFHSRLRELGGKVALYFIMSETPDPRKKMDGLLGLQVVTEEIKKLSGWSDKEVFEFERSYVSTAKSMGFLMKPNFEDQVLHKIHTRDGKETPSKVATVCSEKRPTFSDIPGIDAIIHTIDGAK